jgi:hypothetical protein
MGISDGTNMILPRAGVGDASGTTMLDVLGHTYNGTTSDRLRSIAGASTTVATGILATGSVPNATIPAFTTYTNPALTTGVAQIKATSGRIYDLHIDNANTAMTYVQFFDVAAATTVTLGTTTPTFILAVAAGGVLDKTMVYPYAFANGIKIAATTTATGSTAAASAVNITAGYV